MFSTTQLLLAFLVSTLICTLFYWRGSLSRSGVTGAMIIGICILGVGGWVWGIMLGFFFISSSFLSHFKENEKQAVAAEKFDKGHTRDFGQTIANGGPGAILAILSAIYPAPFWLPLFIGVMATVTADTWATELGTLATRPPRLITNGRIVPPGTSGGVTFLGTAVSLSGGLVIGGVASLFGNQLVWWLPILLGGIGGLTGSLCDSLLGATVQTLYIDIDGHETERSIDQYGRPTQYLRGWRWLTNDWVNALASLVGGGVAGGLWYWLQM